MGSSLDSGTAQYPCSEFVHEGAVFFAEDRATEIAIAQPQRMLERYLNLKLVAIKQDLDVQSKVFIDKTQKTETENARHPRIRW